MHMCRLQNVKPDAYHLRSQHHFAVNINYIVTTTRYKLPVLSNMPCYTQSRTAATVLSIAGQCNAGCFRAAVRRRSYGCCRCSPLTAPFVNNDCRIAIATRRSSSHLQPPAPRSSTTAKRVCSERK
jgi:hypothetical protein